MKSFQDRLFKDFDAKKVIGEDGKARRVYTYVGDYAVWNLTAEELGRYKRLYACAGVLLCVLYLCKSLVPVPLNSSRYVGGATLFALVPLIALVMGLWQFVRAKKEMYLRDCREMKDLILWGSILYLVIQTIGVVMSIVHFIAEGVSFPEILVILAGFAAGFLSFILFREQKQLTILEIPGKKTKTEDDKE